MSFDLSFSPEFFLGDAEDYYDPELSDRPTSVIQAVVSLNASEWEKCCEAAGLDPNQADVEDVLEVIKETNACANLDSPVEVYVDPKGYFTLRVYDRED